MLHLFLDTTFNISVTSVSGFYIQYKCYTCFWILHSVFNKSRKPANFAVYCGIFSGYFISDKNRSVLFRDQLYVFWDCLYSGSVFVSVCFSPFFRFETGNQSLLDLNNFLDLTLASFLCKICTIIWHCRTTWETVEISLICLKGRYWTSSSQAQRLSSLEVCIS